MALLRAAARHCIAIATASGRWPGLTLMDRATSDRVPWVPRAEQIEAWEVMDKHPRTVFAKPRKTGISTACTLPEVVEVLAAAAAGNVFLCVVAIDTDDKAQRQAQIAVDFAQQLGAKIRPNEHGFKTSNGAELICATAGGYMPGRGTTIHRLRCSELPFWRTPRETYQSLRSACADNTPIVIDTTMDVSTDNFPRDLWRGFRRDPVTGAQIPVGPEFHRHMFTVEHHLSYRLPPGAITDEEWALCKANHGFTMRGAAAWWLRHALEDLCAGDEQRLWHDYPQAEWHLFASATGRVIGVTSEIAPVVERLELHGLSGKRWTLDVYVRPGESSGHHVVSVDTAWGRDKTRSVVLVTDLADGRILASFSSALVMYDDLARMAQVAWHAYSQDRNRCDVVIEINGSGNATAHEAHKIGLPFVEMDQVANYHAFGEDACIRHVTRMIETVDGDGHSIVSGPPELADECDSLQKVRGDYKGLKDIVMTYGMALIHREARGIRDKEELRRWKARRLDITTVHVEDRMKEARREAKQRRL